MTQPLPDPKLRRALETVDQLKRELMKERMRASQLKVQLSKLRTNDAAPKQREQRPRC